MTSASTIGSRGKETILALLRGVPDLDYFDPSRLDPVGQEIVAVDDEFPYSGYDLAPQERMSAQDLSLRADLARELLTRVGIVLGDVFEDFRYLGNRAA